MGHYHQWCSSLYVTCTFSNVWRQCLDLFPAWLVIIALCFTLGNVDEILSSPTATPYIQDFYHTTQSAAATTAMVAMDHGHRGSNCVPPDKQRRSLQTAMGFCKRQGHARQSLALDHDLRRAHQRQLRHPLHDRHPVARQRRLLGRPDLDSRSRDRAAADELLSTPRSAVWPGDGADRKPLAWVQVPSGPAARARRQPGLGGMPSGLFRLLLLSVGTQPRCCEHELGRTRVRRCHTLVAGFLCFVGQTCACWAG